MARIGALKNTQPLEYTNKEPVDTNHEDPDGAFAAVWLEHLAIVAHFASLELQNEFGSCREGHRSSCVIGSQCCNQGLRLNAKVKPYLLNCPS